jgi:hypothetical protein
MTSSDFFSRAINKQTGQIMAAESALDGSTKLSLLTKRALLFSRSKFGTQRTDMTFGLPKLIELSLLFMVSPFPTEIKNKS